MNDWNIRDVINTYLIAPSQLPSVRSYSPEPALEQLAEITQHFRARILHSNTDGWDAWGARLQHRSFTITARFHHEHPYEPPLIYLSPAPKDPHYYVHHGETVARLCWCQPGEWHPRYRLIIAVATAIRFINDHQIGKTQ